MIHYTCDRCRRAINPAQGVRHVVKIELETMLDTAVGREAEGDRDYLGELDDALQSVELDDEFELGCVSGSLCFDLCSECYRKYLRNPLGAESPLHVGFSHN